MPMLCCGSSSVQVDPPGTKPTNKKKKKKNSKSDPEEDENNNEGESNEDEVADNPEYAQASPGQSNGQLKSSPHNMKYEVNPADPDTTATSAANTSKGDDSSVRASKRGARKLPAKKKGSVSATEEAEGDHSSEKLSERSTPPKKKNAKKSSFRDTEEMEMSPLDPGFYNTATLQATRQLYAQHTFEEEDEEFLENVEEERRKNKQRQRMKKKHGSSAVVAAHPAPDTVQAAYERAQQEIDKVLGPRQNSHPTTAAPGVIVGDSSDKRRSKRRSQRGQVNQAYREEEGVVPATGAAIAPVESLEEMKSRVHALLDDAFSLFSNSYTSMGNRVAPASPSKPSTSEGPAALTSEPDPLLAKSPAQGNMPAVEEMPDATGFAPKAGEKLHTPVLVDRTYGDYDTDGLITWSPYRASDDSARIVLPETQPPSSIKAPAQEKLQTTTFMGLAATGSNNGSGAHHHQHPHHHHPTTSTQPIIIRTRQPPPTFSSPPATPITLTQPKAVENQHSRTDPVLGTGPSPAFSATADSDYTPYPGLEAYEDMLAEGTTTTSTTTALFTTAAPSGDENSPANGDAGESTGSDDKTAPSDPLAAGHTPPTRDVGTRDARDFITSSVGTGTSAKELVDSIRQELKSLSGKLPPASSQLSKVEGGVSNGGAHRDKLLSRGDVVAVGDQRGVSNGNPKPLKKPRKSSYLDST